MQVDFNKYNLDETVENYLIISMFESIVETNETYENSSGYNPYRDPKSGEFTDAPFSKKMTKKGDNRQKIEEQKIISTFESISEKHTGSVPARKIPQVLGMSGKPKVVSVEEYDNLEGKEIYRVESGKTVEEALSYRDKFINDTPNEYEIPSNGGAIYGVGKYFASNKADTERYVQSDSSIMFRGKLASDAKIVNYKDVVMKRKTIKDAIEQKLGKPPLQMPAGNLLADPGFIAGAMGADAIETPEGYIVLINRSKVILSNE